MVYGLPMDGEVGGASARSSEFDGHEATNSNCCCEMFTMVHQWH